MYFFIVNPASHSGKGMQLWQQAEAILLERKVPYQVSFSQGPGDIARMARQITGSIPEGEERCLIVLGGDGTVNEAVNGIVDFERVLLGYIPTGSSNDLARNMRIGTNVGDTLEGILIGKRACRMDLGSVSWEELGVRRQRRFVVSCGIGYDAAVCQEALSSGMKDVFNRIGLGKLTYLGIGLKQMFSIGYVNASLRLDGGEAMTLKRLLFIANMSHRYEGGGFCFCPQAEPEDGLLDLCVVSGVPKWKFPIIIPFALKGKHYRFAGVEHYRASRVEIEASVPMWVHTDGEIPGKCSRIAVTVEKQMLRFVY